MVELNTRGPSVASALVALPDAGLAALVTRLEALLNIPTGSVTAGDISDATTLGRTLLQAATQAAARSAIGGEPAWGYITTATAGVTLALTDLNIYYWFTNAVPVLTVPAQATVVWTNSFKMWGVSTSPMTVVGASGVTVNNGNIPANTVYMLIRRTTNVWDVAFVSQGTNSEPLWTSRDFTASTDTLALADFNRFTNYTNAAAAVTIPAQATIAFSDFTKFEWLSTNAMTVIGAAGVTINGDVAPTLIIPAGRRVWGRRLGLNNWHLEYRATVGVSTVSASTYNLLRSDNGRVLAHTAAAPLIQIPAQGSGTANFEDGSWSSIVLDNRGTITALTGVTLNGVSVGSFPLLSEADGMAYSLIRRSANRWIVPELLSASARAKLLGEAAGITADGTYVTTVTKSGTVWSAAGEPLIIVNDATSYDLLAGQAAGLAGEGRALRRWQDEWRTLGIASGLVTYRFPDITDTPDAATTRNRTRNARVAVSGTTIAFAIDNMNTAQNAAIAARDERHIITVEFNNAASGAVDCALTFATPQGDRMPIEWAGGFSNPTIVKGTILTLTATVTQGTFGYRAVVSQAVRSRAARTLMTAGNSSGNSNLSLGNNTNLRAIPGDLALVWFRGVTTGTFPIPPAAKNYVVPSALAASNGAITLQGCYKFLTAADIVDGVFTTGVATNGSRTMAEIHRNISGIGAMAATGGLVTTRTFSPLPTIIDPAVVTGIVTGTGSGFSIPAGTTEITAASPTSVNRCFITTAEVGTYAPAAATAGTSQSYVEAAVELL